MKLIFLITIMSMLLLINQVQAYDLKAKVVKVIDGDTIVVKPTGKDPFKVRLSLINTPESGESGFQQAKSYVNGKCYNHIAKLSQDNPYTDKYGRRIMMVNCEDTLINKALIQKGLAEIYIKNY